MTTNEQIREFILEELDCRVPPNELTDDVPLIVEKIIDFRRDLRSNRLPRG